MPYTVTDSADGCAGYAVVKEGENTPIPGGCHKTRADAIAHMVAIEADYQDGEPESEPSEERAEVNLVAPSFMKMSARRGLRLHEEGHSGEGLKPQTVEDARKMAEGVALSEDKWRRIAPWIARHIVDLDAVSPGEITAGLVAMLLWGGGSSKSSARRAQDYAERLVARLDEKRYDPDQPRDDDGKFGEGGGGGGDGGDDGGGGESTDKYGLPTVSDEKANEVASTIDTKSNSFVQGGGTVDGVDEESVEGAIDSANAVREAQASQGLSDEQKTALDRGHKMTQAALRADQADNVVLVARDAEGRTAGAIQFSAAKIDPETGLDVDEAGEYMKVHHLGSLGTVDGVGSALAREAIGEAARRGTGIVLEPWGANASAFWGKMGFREIPGGAGMYLTPASTKKISDRLGS